MPDNTPGDISDDASGGTSGDATPVVLPSSDLGRSIVYTASIDLRAGDVAVAARALEQALVPLGGMLFSRDTTGESQPLTTLVFRVPPEDFDTAVARIEEVGQEAGTLVDQTVRAEDVTDRVVDLESRIRSADVSVERLRRLIEEADTLETITALENQLLERETTLERLRGQLRSVAGQAALATITVRITEASDTAAMAQATVVTTAYVGDDGGARCPGQDHLAVDEGEPVTVCVSVDNTGDVVLAALAVRDPGLGLQREDFALVDALVEVGEGERVDPGRTAIAWASWTASPGDAPEPSVTAVPVDGRGEPVRQRLTTHEETATLTVAGDDALPGFGDSLHRGWGALAGAVGLVLVGIGVATPFILPVGVAVAGYGWWRRRRPVHVGGEEPAGEATAG